MNQSTVVHALQVSLHGHVVGHLAGFHNGRNIFVFADEYRLNQNRPTLGLVTHPNFPGAQKIMSEPWAGEPCG